MEALKDGSSVGGGEDQVSPRRQSYLQWSTPTLMLGSFFTGIVFAIAHHVYYMRLNDTLVGSSTRQQWPIRFGTAFAFLVKTCLATATGTAYIQWAWRRCRQRAVTIGGLDAAFAVDSRILLLFRLDFLFEFPIPFGLAVLLWCIPLSALITPATLSVESKPNTTLHTLLVNQPSISNFDPIANSIYSPRVGESAELSRVLTILASTGELPHMSAPQGLQNASYSLELIVPIVRCFASDETVRTWTAAAAYYDVLAAHDPVVDFVPHAQNLTYTAKQDMLGQIGYYGMLGNTSITPNQPGIQADVWIAIANPPNGTSELNLTNEAVQYSASYYTCSLRNASVPTNITFVDNVQSLQIGAVRELDFNQSNVTDTVGNESAPIYALENYSNFGSLLYGYLLGFAAIEFGQDGRGSLGWYWNTTMDQTILGTATDFSTIMMAWKDGGLEPGAVVQNRNLTSLIEEFSLNASLSLMSHSAFSDKTMAQVNQTIWLNKYTYEPRNLMIAYGCSILASMITILAGAYAIHANGRSYDTNFSTISNAVQSPEIQAHFDLHSTGTSPLEKKITKTRIRLLGEGADERFRLETERVKLIDMDTQKYS